MTTEKILVVEDESIVAMELQARLTNLGYSIAAAVSSGEEAIKKTKETLPDLVLMDIILKGAMDGIEAAEQIRSCFDIPVVYLTAYGDNETLRRAKITEPFGYILKPFQEKELHINIEIALYKHKMERKLKESEQWLAATVDNIGDAVMATDIKGIIKVMNPYAEALTGWKRKEALGKTLQTVVNITSKKSESPVEDPVTKVIREGTFYGLTEDTELIPKDGNKIPVDIIGSPIRDEKNNITGVVFVFYDIQERKKIEEELTKLAK